MSFRSRKRGRTPHPDFARDEFSIHMCEKPSPPPPPPSALPAFLFDPHFNIFHASFGSAVQMFQKNTGTAAQCVCGEVRALVLFFIVSLV